MCVQFYLFDFIEPDPVFFIKKNCTVVEIQDFVFRPIPTAYPFVSKHILGVKVVLPVKAKTLII